MVFILDKSSIWIQTDCSFAGADEAPPKWINPCGGVFETPDSDEESLSDDVIAADAILSVQIALDQMERFKHEFVSLFFLSNPVVQVRIDSMTANFEPLAIFCLFFFYFYPVTWHRLGAFLFRQKLYLENIRK